MVRRNLFNMRITILQNVKPKKDKYSVKDVEREFLNWFKNDFSFSLLCSAKLLYFSNGSGTFDKGLSI